MSKALDIEEGGGIIFFNDDKQSDKSPDWSGQINVDGEILRIALWENEGKKGTFFGVKTSPLEDEDERPRRSSGGGRSSSSRGSYSGGGRSSRPSRSRDEEDDDRDERPAREERPAARRTYQKPSRR